MNSPKQPAKAKEEVQKRIKDEWNPVRRLGRFAGAAAAKPQDVSTQRTAHVPSPSSVPRVTTGTSVVKNEVNVMDWEEEDEMLLAEDEIKVEVAMDSGAIAHVTRPDQVPKGVQVDGSNTRNFMAANGGSIKNYGKARVAMADKFQNQSECIYNVADVTRTLHSTGQICDQDFEVLYTKKGCVVVPQETLSRFVNEAMVVAKSPRKNGGLYLAEFTVKAPQTNDGKDGDAPGFARQGVKR
jgi:hypothetical protein